MHIKEIEDLTLWDKFVKDLNCNTFLHSVAWIEFNKQRKYKLWTLGLFKEDTLVAVALIIKIQGKRGTFLLCPHGPQSSSAKHSLFQDDNYELDNYKLIEEMTTWLSYLDKLAKQQQCSFIRLQPMLYDNDSTRQVFKQLKFRPSPIHMHTELSTVLSLIPSTERILSNMRKTTRQLIKKAEKMVTEGSLQILSIKDFNDELYNTYLATVNRGGFVPYTKSFLEQEFKFFGDYEKSELVIIKQGSKILSWGMFLFVGQRAFYHHGANILTKDVPASYLCHYQGIKLAKEYGCISYDFWGVAPKDQPNHPWVNISKFKRGFGGIDTSLIHAQDYIISPKYWFTWVIETYRAKKRGFKFS